MKPKDKTFRMKAKIHANQPQDAVSGDWLGDIDGAALGDWLGAALNVGLEEGGWLGDVDGAALGSLLGSEIGVELGD